MKNKLLVTLCAAVAVSLAFTSCKPKSDAKDVCDDLLKTSLHKSPRSLLQLKGETLTIKEFEFASANVNDNRIIYREISFGNGVDQTKKVLNLTYEYGDWNDNNTGYSLTFNPATPYASAWYSGNSLITPDGLAFGGEGNANTARVEKWEKTLGTILNTDWEGTFRDKYETDSIFRDSIYKHMSHGKIVRDTIKVFDHLDTLCADTTACYYLTLNRDAEYKNTGHFNLKEFHAKYDTLNKKVDTFDIKIREYDFKWYFTSVSSDSKFVIELKNSSTGKIDDVFDISKYKYEEKYEQDTTTMVMDTIVKHEFLRGGLMFYRPKH